MSPRGWGPWTELKLDVLRYYLSGFHLATKRAGTTVYLDAFAGEPYGINRLTGEEFPGSARIALDIDGPPFTHLRYFELRRSRAQQLRQQLEPHRGDRDVKVYEGDCNVTIPAALSELQHVRRAPTFAFLDPDGMELAWSTIKAISDHKRGLRNKVEQWMLFPSSGLYRNLDLREGQLTEEQVAKADRLYGSHRWRGIHQHRQRELLSYEQALVAYVDLMRWQLHRELGYAYTMALEVKNTRGIVLYHMVFATDHEAGERIMLSAYKQAVGKAPTIRNDIRARGQQSLLEEDLGEDLLLTWTPLRPLDFLED